VAMADAGAPLRAVPGRGSRVTRAGRYRVEAVTGSVVSVGGPGAWRGKTVIRQAANTAQAA